LLPSFPGLRAQRQALEYGVKISGCTVHFVDKGLDTGPIIIQKSTPVFPYDTEESLSDRILEDEHLIYPEAVKMVTERRVKISGRTVQINY
jgi:phosphoribosylglycinamide formyltransferase-1